MRYLLLLLAPLILSSPLAALQVSNLSTIETLSPGEKKRIAITLHNDKNHEEQVDLKLVDYGCNSDGEHFYDEPAGIKPCSNANWVLLGQERVILAPNEEREIYYVIEVPDDKKLSGSYWSVLLIEPADSPLVDSEENEGLKLRIKIRFAHHIICNVGEGQPKIKILKKEIKEIQGDPYLCLHVINKGNLFFKPEITLSLYDSKGKIENTLKSQPERLYPNNSQCFYINLKDIPEQRRKESFKGFILFDGNGPHLFGDRFIYP